MSGTLCLGGSHGVIFGYITETKRMIVILILTQTSVGRDKTCSCQTVHSHRGWKSGRRAFEGMWVHDIICHHPASAFSCQRMNTFFRAAFALVLNAPQGLIAKTAA